MKEKRKMRKKKTDFLEVMQFAVLFLAFWLMITTAYFSKDLASLQYQEEIQEFYVNQQINNY